MLCDLSSKPEGGRGPYRRVGEVLESLIPDPPRGGRQRTALAGPDGRARRHLVDLAHRRPLGRSAGTLSAYQTCHRRIRRWSEEDVLEDILRASAEDLKERGRLKRWRAVARRYEKRAVNCRAVVIIASPMLWLAS